MLTTPGLVRADGITEEGHAGDGREEMHPDHALRPGGDVGDLVDGDGRGVGREHRIRARRPLDLPQHLLLHRQVLEHRLDHELGAAESRVVGATRKQRDEPGVLEFRDATSLEPVVQNLARGRQSFGDARQVGVFHPDVDPRLRDGRARDTRSHEPRAHDSQTVHLARGRGVRDAEVLLERRRGEEDLDELAGYVRHGQLREQLRLALQAGAHAAPQAVLHRVERRERRGIMPSGLPQHLFARRAEHQAAAERVAVEQPRHDAAATFASGPPPARQPPRRVEGDIPQNGRVDQLVHDPHPERLLGGFDLAGEDDVECRARADQPGQSLAATGAGQDAELHFGETELGLGVVGRDAVVARERELEPASETRAMDPHGDGLGEARHAVEQLLPVGGEPLGFGRSGEADELLDVRAGDEIVALTREEGDPLHGAVALERREGREHVVLHGAGDLVDGLALEIERDDGHRAGGELPGERRAAAPLRRHQRRSRTIAKPMPPCAQIDSRPNCASRRVISLASVVTMRAPVAPNG